jgi:hypothetical protein
MAVRRYIMQFSEFYFVKKQKQFPLHMQNPQSRQALISFFFILITYTFFADTILIRITHKENLFGHRQVSKRTSKLIFVARILFNYLFYLTSQHSYLQSNFQCAVSLKESSNTFTYRRHSPSKLLTTSVVAATYTLPETHTKNALVTCVISSFKTDKENILSDPQTLELKVQ